MCAGLARTILVQQHIHGRATRRPDAKMHAARGLELRSDGDASQDGGGLVDYPLTPRRTAEFTGYNANPRL